MSNHPNQSASPDEVGRQVAIGQALDLRIAGGNYRQIAKALKISVGSAHAYVTEGLEQLRNSNAESFEQLRQMEVARLDAMLVPLWAKKDQPRVADTILRLSERRARLLGLDVGKTGDEPPPPPPSTMPAAIHITLVAADGTKLTGSGTIAPPGETKAPAGETKPADGGTTNG